MVRGRGEIYNYRLMVFHDFELVRRWLIVGGDWSCDTRGIYNRYNTACSKYNHAINYLPIYYPVVSKHSLNIRVISNTMHIHFHNCQRAYKQSNARVNATIAIDRT